MRIAANKSLAIVVLILAASSLMAADKPSKGKQAKAKAEPSVIAIPKGLAFDAEQKKAVAALNAEYFSKIQAVKQKFGGVLTDQQKQALADVKQAAKESKQDKAELAKSLRDAVQLSEQQKQQQAELKQQLVALNNELRDRFIELLTVEQREVLRRSKGEAKKVAAKRSGEKTPATNKPISKEPVGKKPTAEKPPVKKPTGAQLKTPVKGKVPDKKPAAKETMPKKPSAKVPAKKVEKGTKDLPVKNPSKK